ncbi:MAG: hypothetical protein HUK40_14160 [Desulfobacter sp.]|nr:hypothetical protein [Desulfobacter sp.]WDP87720.1 MAG: hypothetical protein HUN05_23435 [Desulfobacter sp.]
MTLDFFNPSPHGKILMNNCGLEQETLLGKEGRAFSDMVLLFRKIEDAVMTGPVTGAMGFVLSQVIQKMKGVSKIAPQFLDGLGRLETMVAAAVCLSDQIALAADKNEAKLESLVLYFRQMTGEYLKVLDQILNGSGIDLDLPCKYLILDLAAASRMGKSMAGIRREKLGLRLLDPGRTCWNPSFITDPV